MEYYLIHHGIKGQKWGIRRFQNYDGTRIHTVSNAERNVRKNLSNSYTSFDKKNPDLNEVKQRSGLRDDDAIKCISLALKKFNKASKEEPKITSDIVDSVSNTSGKMYGLQNRLKQPSSLAGKIGSDSKEKNVSFTKASEGIKDAIRYTVVSEDKDFVKNYFQIRNDLNDKGYTETKCKNYFDLYNQGKVMHKAVQCNFKSPDGYEFELQFQTPSSQAAKELKIPIYEERRKVGISNQRAEELESQMRVLAESVSTPKNIYTIKSK